MTDESTHVCPLCGHPVDGLPSIKVVPDRRGALIGGEFYHLPNQAMKILEILVNGHGRTLSNDFIIASLWNEADEPEYAYDIVKVHISRLRRILRPAGIRIVTEWGFGYRLAMADEANPRPKGRFCQDFYQPEDFPATVRGAR